jgi:hypothetical protein
LCAQSPRAERTDQLLDQRAAQALALVGQPLLEFGAGRPDVGQEVAAIQLAGADDRRLVVAVERVEEVVQIPVDPVLHQVDQREVGPDELEAVLILKAADAHQVLAQVGAGLLEIGIGPEDGFETLSRHHHPRARKQKIGRDTETARRHCRLHDPVDRDAANTQGIHRDARYMLRF